MKNIYSNIQFESINDSIHSYPILIQKNENNELTFKFIDLNNFVSEKEKLEIFLGLNENFYQLQNSNFKIGIFDTTCHQHFLDVQAFLKNVLQNPLNPKNFYLNIPHIYIIHSFISPHLIDKITSKVSRFFQLIINKKNFNKFNQFFHNLYNCFTPTFINYNHALFLNDNSVAFINLSMGGKNILSTRTLHKDYVFIQAAGNSNQVLDYDNGLYPLTENPVSKNLPHYFKEIISQLKTKDNEHIDTAQLAYDYNKERIRGNVLEVGTLDKQLNPTSYSCIPGPRLWKCYFTLPLTTQTFISKNYYEDLQLLYHLDKKFNFPFHILNTIVKFTKNFTLSPLLWIYGYPISVKNEYIRAEKYKGTSFTAPYITSTLEKLRQRVENELKLNLPPIVFANALRKTAQPILIKPNLEKAHNKKSLKSFLENSQKFVLSSKEFLKYFSLEEIAISRFVYGLGVPNAEAAFQFIKNKYNNFS